MLEHPGKMTAISSVAMVATALASMGLAMNALGSDPSKVGLSETSRVSFSGITFLAQLLALVAAPAGIVCAGLLRSGLPSSRPQRLLVSLLAGLTLLTCVFVALGAGGIALLNSIQIDGCAHNGCPEMGIAQRAGVTVTLGALVTGAIAALILSWSAFPSRAPDARLPLPTPSRVAAPVAAKLSTEMEQVVREFASREASLSPAAHAEVARAIAARIRPLIPESSAHPDDVEFVRAVAAALPGTRPAGPAPI